MSIASKHDQSLGDLPLAGVPEADLSVDIDGITEIDVTHNRTTEAVVHVDSIELAKTDSINKGNSRVQAMTAKGLEYKLDIKKRRRNKVYRETQSKASNIRSRLIEDVSTTEIHLVYGHWLTLYDNFLDAQEDYDELLIDNDEDHRWFQQVNVEFCTFKKDIEVWMTKHKHQPHDTLSHLGKASSSLHLQGFLRTPDRSEDIKSHSSRTSSVASKASSMKLKEILNHAELKIKASFLEQKKVKIEEEEQRLMEQLAISNAKQAALDQFIADENRAARQSDIVSEVDYKDPVLSPRQRASQHHYDDHVNTSPSLNPKAQEHVKMQTTSLQPVAAISSLSNPEYSMIPKQITTFHHEAAPSSRHLTPVTSRLLNQTENADMVKALIDITSLNRLPLPEPGVFSGDPLKFPSWRGAFHTLIESRGIPPSERLHYLNKYLAGPAREAVEGCFFLTTDTAYDEAMELLRCRFGDTFLVASAFRDKLDAWPKLQVRDGPGLRKLSDFLRQCSIAMNSVSGLTILNDERENRKLLMKLPDWMISRWGRKVADYKSSHGIFPPFYEFTKFIQVEADLACDPITSLQSLKPDVVTKKTPHNKPNSTARTLSTVSENTSITKNGTNNGTPRNQTYKPKTCPLCKGKHELDDCWEFPKKILADRETFIRQNKLCLACLIPGHRAKDCRRRKFCRTCKQRHPTALHGREPPRPRGAFTRDGVSMLNDSDSSTRSTMIVPVWVSHQAHPENECLTYALLDTQSDTSFVTKSITETLNLVGTDTLLRLSTLSAADQLIQSEKFKGLFVRAHDSSQRISLPTVFSRDRIPAKKSHIPTPEVAMEWPHLEKIANKLLPLDTCEMGLLIGYDCPRALLPRDVIPPPNDGTGPYAQRTDLGWSIVGGVNSSRESFLLDSVGVSHAVIARDQIASTHQTVFSFRCKVTEVINPADIQRMMEMDFSERFAHGDEKALSPDDKKFLTRMEEGICRRDGHYEMPLPFRDDNPQLPNNKFMVEKRLFHLRNKLLRDEQYRTDYTNFVEDMIDKGFAEEIKDLDSAVIEREGRMWYIPHHGVYHKCKPGKIRVVFDCSAQFQGKSLNALLLQGPDLISNLTGILLRFRKEPIALVCDIQQMFHQFKVQTQFRDFLRFLWWEKGDINLTPKEYRMTVHLFGAKSSPGCANYALKRIAEDFEPEYGADAAKFITHNFYVDDGLISVATEDEAINLLQRTKQICSSGGLHLHKFASNSIKVLESVDVTDRTKSITSIDLTNDQLPLEKALGVQWCMESDTFQFRITLSSQPLTRRGILATVSSVFDPLGLVAPVILGGRLILQEICALRCDWDDPVPENIRTRWETWKQDLLCLKDLKIRRCFKTDNIGEIKTVELHHFSDASSHGYGQCSYIRLIDDKQNVQCSLVCGKARVAPTKAVTIPRLELTAAVVSASVSIMLQKELKLEPESYTEIFWTDSSVVLGYIRNESRRFHVFVANRIQRIRDSTDPSQWRHVRGDQNPADEASRGISAKKLLNGSKWFQGPDFLLQPHLPITETEEINVSEDDPEVKKCHIFATIQQNKGNFDITRFDRFSSWRSLCKAVAFCAIYVTKLRKRVSLDIDYLCQDTNAPPKLTMDDLKNAENIVISFVQQSAFRDEIETLRTIGTVADDRINVVDRRRQLKTSSKLQRLDPFLDNNGILRVGGRLRRSSFGTGVNFPAILPKKSHVTNLIIQHFHEKIGHQGRGFTLNEIRSNEFWILHGCSAVTSFIFRCVDCRRFRGFPQEQKMADLPEDRLAAVAPFTYSAVDYFGPWLIKERRSELKRYGVIFTCLCSRAVHLETATSLNTSSFINALRRFLAIRGPIKELRSDRGTNFVGAERELREALDEMNADKVKDFLLDQGCDTFDFNFNPPAASHMGGVWERQIRSVRSVLTSLLRDLGTQLDDECLRTLMLEVTAIINSRPLTVESINDPTLMPLTPNQLLTMKSEVLLSPPGNFQRADIYASRRWRRVQFLANMFWNRWRKEYLQNLQSRQKWTKPKREIQVGDVVLMKDNNIVRSEWSLARVSHVIPSPDGHVRKVRLLVGDRRLDRNGKRVNSTSYLERPIQKLILLLEAQRTGDVPVREP